jgi:5'-nucleotidase/UDP-sugar diphosphatase
MRTSLLAALCLVWCGFAGCQQQSAVVAPAPVVDAGPPRRTVSVLITGHETGQLVSGAARLLAQWKTQQKWPDAIALSTGDMFSGQAISSYFLGESTAEVMKALQYRAGALGNHDLDLGPDTLRAFRSASGLTLLAANLKDRVGAEKPLKLEPFTVIERGGVKVGVVGLTGPKTITTVVAGRSTDLELVPTETVLPAAIAGARKAGAEVVVVLVDDCFGPLAKQFEAHADWRVDLVVGSRCEEQEQTRVREVPFFSVGDNLSVYVAARIEVTGAAVAVTATRVPVDPKGPQDPDLLALHERWQKQLNQALGASIGFSKTGLKADSAQLGTLVVTALREQTKSEAALINRKGIRDGLPKGPLTAEHVYSMIPFENAVLTVIVTGEVLLTLKANPEAVLALPAKVEKDKTYQLATTEYLYFGGDGLGLEALAPSPELTGQVWQTPVVAWLAKLGSSEKRPLEKLIK